MSLIDHASPLELSRMVSVLDAKIRAGSITPRVGSWNRLALVDRVARGLGLDKVMVPRVRRVRLKESGSVKPKPGAQQALPGGGKRWFHRMVPSVAAGASSASARFAATGKTRDFSVDRVFAGSDAPDFAAQRPEDSSVCSFARGILT